MNDSTKKQFINESTKKQMIEAVKEVAVEVIILVAERVASSAKQLKIEK